MQAFERPELMRLRKAPAETRDRAYAAADIACLRSCWPLLATTMRSRDRCFDHDILSSIARLTLDGCPTCIGDFNQNGGVDGADVGFFFERWEAGC